MGTLLVLFWPYIFTQLLTISGRLSGRNPRAGASRAINEILTPERFQRLCKDVQSTAKTWLRDREKWAAALQGELIWLDEGQYEENKFVLCAFVGQVTRLGKDQEPAQKHK
jgi:hypothetical protein